MGIKAWFKEHKKLVTRVGFGAAIGLGFGVACRLIFKEDVSVDPVVIGSSDGVHFPSGELFEKIVNTFSDKAMDATFDTLKDKIVDADKYKNLDDYLDAIGRTILVPGGNVYAETGEVIFD